MDAEARRRAGKGSTSVGTHWESCWSVHHQCAIEALERVEKIVTMRVTQAVAERDAHLDTVERRYRLALAELTRERDSYAAFSVEAREQVATQAEEIRDLTTLHESHCHYKLEIAGLREAERMAFDCAKTWERAADTKDEEIAQLGEALSHGGNRIEVLEQESARLRAALEQYGVLITRVVGYGPLCATAPPGYGSVPVFNQAGPQQGAIPPSAPAEPTPEEQGERA